MSIDNISRIDTKKDKSITYIFDLPSLEDNEGIVSYSLSLSRDGKINISKITDYEELFQRLHTSKTISIKYQSKDYKEFINIMSNYMDNISNEETSLNDEDIEMITSEYESEIQKKGNTDILTKRHKKVRSFN